MYALSFAVLMPLLAAAAPADPRQSATTTSAIYNPAPTGGPSLMLGGTFCAANTGPQAVKDRAFFAKADSVLSGMKFAWNTVSEDKWSLPNSKGQTVSGNVQFWVEKHGDYSDPGTCINEIRESVYKVIDVGATGGQFNSHSQQGGSAYCVLHYQVNMDDPKQNVCSSW